MKLNKKRKDARLPNWLIDLLTDLQIKYQWTFTETLTRTAEKGSTYYGKRWMKMHPNEKASEEAPETNDERCPNDRQNNYNQNEQEEKVSDQEVEEMLDNIYGKDRKK